MATPYEPPAWAAGGANVSGLSLDVIRNGVLVESLALPLDPAKSFVVAGRMEPLCDLVLQHPSLSRVHAVLQFDASGALFLQDMKSTHGTFVNKKRLAPLRFTRLHVGDMVVFGESTRKYAVCGPEELRPEEPDMARLRAKLQHAKQAERAREERETAGASWGFREDAEEEDSDEEEEDSNDDKATAKRGGRGGDDDLPEYLRGLREPGRGSAYESSVKQSDVSEKDQKLFTQLQNKIAKMGNLETEKARILAKQNDLHGGLSEGQQKTLERNNARIESLAKEIAELEDRIHARNAQRDQSRASQRKAAPSKAKTAADAYAYDSDEDDFYDRTSANQKKLNARKQALATGDAKQSKSAAPAKKTEVLTAEIIQAKIRMLESDLKDLNTEYARVEADTESGGDGSVEGAALDALEAFMQSTARELHAKELARVRTRREEVETELKKQRQLLAIAMPALRNEQPPAASSAPSLLSRPVVGKEAAPSTKPASPAATTHVAPVVAEKTTRDAEMLPGSADPHGKETPRPREETETPPVVEKTEEQPTAAPPKKRRVMGPTLPPPSAAVKKAAVDPSTLEGGDRVWVPPANQTGDGRTKLNDKYGY